MLHEKVLGSLVVINIVAGSVTSRPKIPTRSSGAQPPTGSPLPTTTGARKIQRWSTQNEPCTSTLVKHLKTAITVDEKTLRTDFPAWSPLAQMEPRGSFSSDLVPCLQRESAGASRVRM